MIIRPSRESDCHALFPILRQQDRTEIELSSGDRSVDVLVRALRSSDEAFTAISNDGTVFGMYGVADVQGLGSPWMVASPEVYRYSKALVKDGREWVRQMQSRYPVLFNFVHADNAASIAWLRKLGFTIGELVPDYGAGRAPFYLFYRNRNV